MDFEKIAKNLENNSFEVSLFDTKEEASEYLNKKIDGTSVGFGGSATVSEMGLFESLSKHNETFYHGYVPEGKTKNEIINSAQNADIYISSANAITYNGEIVNIDGRGNRVASTLHGHKKVYIIVGQNKFEPTLDKAIYRARNIAAPKNAKRLNRKTPCAIKADKCYDCNSPDRICCGLVVHYKKVFSCDMEIVIIKENLGY